MKKIFDKYYKYILYLLLAFMLSSFVLLYLLLNNKCEVSKELVLKEEQTESPSLYYFIDLKGEVKNPGVYKISSESRIIDAVEIAGGLTTNADISLLNLSKKVVDEMNVRIYSKKEVENAKKNLKEDPKVVEIIKEIEKECVCIDDNAACINDKEETVVDTDSSIDTSETNKLVNLNTASKEELITIPGIGESKATSIITYRNSNPFTSLEDVKNVSGIGEAIFEKIKEYITI